jgi:formylglycine-generating enzyme required for sulfatase activity/CHAT domain-containing protein/Tfp pilus assembly protein PilF
MSTRKKLRNTVIAGLLVVVLASVSTVTTVSARQTNINAIYRALMEDVKRADYPAAQLEAKKFAEAVKDQFGTSHPNYAQALNNLGNIYSSQGKYNDAEQMYQRALAIYEKAVGTNDPRLGQTLNNLAVLYRRKGDYVHAEQLYRRALAIREKSLGPDHLEVAQTLNNLAFLLNVQRKYAEAADLGQRALSIREKVLGVNAPDVAQTLDNLGQAYQGQGNFSQAEQLYMRSLAIREKVLGKDHPDVAAALITLAGLYYAQGNYIQADRLYQRAAAIYVKTYGPSYPDLANVRENLTRIDLQLGDIANALARSRKAIGAILAHSLSEAQATRQFGQLSGLIEKRANFFRTHVAIVAAAAQKKLGPPAALAEEAFESAQWALQASASVAVQQMAARFASGSGALGALVRENQDLTAAWRNTNSGLIAMLSQPGSQQNYTAIGALRRQIEETEDKLAANRARFEREFPDYAALADPKPLKSDEVQKLLGVDEAMVFFLTGDRQSYVFALTRDGFEWYTLPVGQNALADKVDAFRRGLDVDELNRSIAAGKPVLFDLGLAHELYATLLGPVEGLFKDKRSLLVVPSGPLTALPFHLLVTEKPPASQPDGKDATAAYRNAAWLLKSHAVTVLPAVASLKALRVFARHDEASKPFIGFGDPVFKDESAPPGSQRAAIKVATRTIAYSDYWRGAGVDRAKLADDLPPLPDTADELKAVAAKLGAPASDIYIGLAASETTVKKAPLADYRVVYFATHALVAGDVKGLGEPALALSLPKQPTPFDDGLLTASEVAQLKMDADWVVLSACNTAAGDKPGAEALSGLARAFFYAGARALLVSHWSVDSDAATRLTTSTFAILKDNPNIGRAEALRRAELAYLNDTSDPRNAYPAFWGPFEIVGEGAAKQVTPTQSTSDANEIIKSVESNSNVSDAPLSHAIKTISVRPPSDQVAVVAPPIVPATPVRTCAVSTMAVSSSRPAEPLTAAEECALKPRDSFKECDKCPEMIVVPPGSFTMGSPDDEKERSPSEGPQHQVTFAHSFSVGRFAVTFDEWDACVADGGCDNYLPIDENWGRGRRPVINVDWNDAQAYVAWLSRRTGRTYRLLSEAEREYVARAGTTTPFWWGPTISAKQVNQVNFADGFTSAYGHSVGIYRGKTVPVDSLQPNPWGLYQVLGNVWEWTEDCWNYSFRGAPSDGSAWSNGDCRHRVLRGGSWVDGAWRVRAASRYGTIDPTYRINYIGFRVARTLIQ